MANNKHKIMKITNRFLHCPVDGDPPPPQPEPPKPPVDPEIDPEG